MNITEILQHQAAARPTAPAIIEGDGRRTRITSFAELEAASARAAGLLQQAGLRQGDVVLIFLPMSAELYIALGAIFRLGLMAMFVDPGAGITHIERCCALHPPQALIAAPKAHLLRLGSPALRRIPLKFAPGLWLPGARRWDSARAAPIIDSVALQPDAPALLTFTSGSTGMPKAAVRSHGFLLAQHQALKQSLELQAGGIDLATLPIVALANLASGVTSLIPNADLRRPGHIDPRPVVEQLRAYRATSAAASPALLERLAGYCETHGITLPDLRRLFSGGAPVFPRLLDRLQHIAPNATIIAVYGSTEAEPIAHIERSAFDAAERQAMNDGAGLLVGRPVQAIELRIIPDRWGQPLGPFSDEEFMALCLPPGAAGEIVVAGPHVLQGYLNGQGNHETKITVDGTTWHRTGDAGYLDEQGRLWLLGRCAARFDNERGSIYPLAVEAAVAGDERIRRAAWIAHNNRRILALELDARGTGRLRLEQLQLAGHLMTHIDEIRVYDRLPIDRRHNAKIDYPALRALLERRPLWSHGGSAVVPGLRS